MDDRSPNSSDQSNHLSKDEVDILLHNYRKQIQDLRTELLTVQSERQEKLTISDSLQSFIPDLIQQAVIVTDIAGNIIYWNNFATTLYGWSGEEVMGRNVMAFISSDLTYAEGMAIMEKLREGETWSGEYIVKHKDQHSFKVHVHDSPFYDEDGNIAGIIGISRDVSEEVQTKELIRLQSNLLNHIEQAVFATDLEGNVFYWNNQAEELYGWTRDEVNGKQVPINTRSTPAFAAIQEELMRTLSGGKSWYGELTLENKHQNVIHVYSIYSPIKNQDGELTGIIAVSNDITEQKKASQEKEYERLNQEALINSTKDLIWSVNTNYELITANHAFLERVKTYTGTVLKTGDRLLNNDFFPNDYLAFWKEKYDQGLKGETISFEIYVSPMSGSPERWSEATINPILNSQNQIIGIACYGRDITAAKLSAQTIRQSEERFRIMFEEAPLGIALIDSYSGTILDVNKKFAFITGRSIEELKSIDWMTITHPDDIQEDLDNMKLLNEKKIPGFTMQKRYIKPDQSIVWIQMSIVPIVHRESESPRHLCMIEDITQMKNNVRKIEESNERFNLVAKATNDAIWDWDLTTDQVIRLGAGLEKYFGYSSEEASQNNDFWHQRVHPDDIEGVLKRRNELLEKPNEQNWWDEYRFLKANGEYAYVFDKGYIMRDQTGKPVRLIGATQDITEQKKADQRLQELNKTLEKRAEELEKSNADLEQFAYVASHDLQEPLRMISSFLQLLEKNYKNQIDETADKYIHFAVDGAERMRRLIHDLLEYSRSGRSLDELGNTDMNDVVKDVIEIYQQEIQTRNAIIEVEQLPILPETRRVQMFQLLQNIIGNALKYNSSASPRIEIKSITTATEIQISIKDNGLGFESKYSEKVFMIFQRLHNQNQFSGTGIGLAICKKIMDLHGGKISVQSEPGKGSTFFLTFFKNKNEQSDDNN